MRAGKKHRAAASEAKEFIIYSNNNSSIIIFVQAVGHQFSQGDAKTRGACLPAGVFHKRGTSSLGNPNLFFSFLF